MPQLIFVTGQPVFHMIKTTGGVVTFHKNNSSGQRP